MKFGELTFQNYGSFFGMHAMRLDTPGLFGVFGTNHDEPKLHSNGAGKSTCFDALDWCLYGEVPRKDAADSVVNEEAGKDTVVSVEVLGSTGGLEAKVERFRKTKDGAGVRFWREGVEVTSLDKDETQRGITAFLGMDRQVFHASVLFAQKRDFDFADATDSRRKEILTRILQLSDLDVWHSSAKAKLSAHDLKVASLGEGYNKVLADWEQLKAVDPQQTIDQWGLDREHRLSSLKAEYEAAGKELAELQSTYAQLPPPTLQASDPAPSKVAREAYLERSGQAQAAQAHLAAVTGGSCPTCGQVVPDKGDVPAAIAKRDACQHSLQTAEEAWRQEQQQSASWEAQRLVGQKMEAVRTSQERQLALVQDRANTKYAAFTQVSQEVNPYLSHLAKHAAALAALLENLKTRKDVITDALEKRRYLEFWTKGFAAKGLKSFVLDASLASMNEEINRWLQILFGGTIWVRCETQKLVGKGKKARLVEDFSIRVFRHNPDGTTTERGYRSWSGGEKDRIALGVDFGLSRLVARRASKSWDLLIIDELFRQSIDDSGKDAIGEMLVELAKTRETIFIVDHSPAVQGLVNDHLHVVKKDGRSTFTLPQGTTP